MNPVWFGDPGTSIPYCKHNKSTDYPAEAITGLRVQSLADLEKIRQDWDLYAYLRREGVVGQWGHVFRPRVEGDDPVLYFQRMDRAGIKGVLLTTRSWAHPEQGPPGEVRVFPKGLDPTADYDVWLVGRSVGDDSPRGESSADLRRSWAVAVTTWF